MSYVHCSSMLLHHVFGFAIHCVEHCITYIALVRAFANDSVNFGHVSLEPEFVADFLVANFALQSPMHLQDVEAEPLFGAVALCAFFALERSVMLVLRLDVLHHVGTPVD